MFLKRVDLCGFKSFPEKVHLEFAPGIAVVVGPNGSGKSNIADSIRWVLGEQSARAFRGSKMEDVIFAGNHKRKALSLAEVSLTFDNADGSLPLDFSEVTITRRVSRDGQGEYLLNKSPCRLKDIAEWFADTGVGKDSFSVLAQGQVDEILAAKPEERRAIFEEVAGIVKFRNRKRDALKKLAETEEGLVRLGDILQEIERQLGPLKEQEEKARKHLELRQRLMDLQVGVYLTQISKTQAILDDSEKRAERFRQKAVEAAEDLARLEVETAGARRAEDEAGAAIEAVKEKVSSYELEMGRLTEQIRSGEERLKDVVASRETLARESTSLVERLEALEAELASRSAEATGIAQALDGEYSALAEAEELFNAASAGLAGAEEELERRKGELIEVLNDLSSKKNEASEIRLRMEGSSREIARISQEEGRLKGELERIHEAERLIDEGLTRSEAARSESSSLLGEAREKMKGLEAKRLETESRLQECRAELSSAESRVRVLEEMESSLEGYNPGPKTVLAAGRRASDPLPGIIGSIADMIKVPADYARALECALGDALESVVTRVESEAVNAIAYLSRERAGRATFLPAASVRPSALTAEENEVIARSGFARPAMGLVECDPRVLPVVSHVLGRVVIVDTLEHGLELSRKTASRFKIVTMEGELVSPGGGITGGFAGALTGLLSRSGEISALKDRASQLGVEMMALRERMARAVTEREVLAGQIKILEQQVWTAESEIAEAGKEKQRLKAEASRVDERIAGLALEAERARAAIADGEKRLEGLAAALAEAEQAEAAVRLQIQELQEKVRLGKPAKEEAQKVVTMRKVSVAGLESARNNAQEALRRVAGELEEAKQRKASQEAEEKRIEDTGVRIRQEMAAAKARLEECAKAREESKAALVDMTAQREAVLERIAALEKQVQATRKRAQECQDRVAETDVRKARTEVELESLKERLRSEWGVTEPEYGNFTPLRPDDVKEEISSIKAEIDSLGVVNLGAIEEYKATRERHDFLQGQIADMQEARKSLTGVIKDVDRKMSEVFTETFERVRENFRQVFKDVFGGGSADLVLTEGDNPLEAGVEIKAQPPGRRVQNLNLLSGGEKAMTAISLLFAILMTKPSPFVILDEIDAALDDSNVDRFGQLLGRFGGKTQFIVITHQKATMELADRLYGLTMEEPGVSKLISVKLVEKAG